MKLWRRYLLALAVAAQGVINLLSAFLSHPSERIMALRHLVPTQMIDTSRTFTLLSGLLLLVTAWGLRSGKRRAFVAALLLCAVSVPANLLKAIDFEEATAASTLMFLLAISGDSFRVKSRELSFSGLRSRAFFAALGLGLYATLGCWILEARYGGGASLGHALAEAGYRLFGVGHETLQFSPTLSHRVHHIITWFLGSIDLMTAALLVGVAIAALRPAVHRGRHRADRDRVAALLPEYGDSSVSAFALAPDSDYFFSPNGRAVIAYRFESNVLLGIGDPIGPEDELPALLRSFALFCQEHGWAPSFFQSRPERSPHYKALGWRSIHIGEDPILHPDRFSLEGSEMGDVRRATRKLEEAGWEARAYVPGINPIDPAASQEGMMEQLRAISADWMHTRHGEEKGFCMGRFDPAWIRTSWVMAAWHPGEKRAAAFVTWVPIWARRGWALDLTRRRADAPNGVMDFLIVKSVEAARERGDAALSLSLSALASVEKPAEREPPDRSRAFLMKHLARFYDFEGLFRWKKKFAPDFEDRFLVYPDPLALPRVALALARAQSPGGLHSYFRRGA